MLIFVLRFLTNPRQRRWVALLILCAALLAMPSMALAHGDGGISPETAARAWSWPLHMVIGLALLALVYSRGVRNVWTRAGIGRGIRWGQVAAFAGAVILLAAAVFSPLDAMSDALLSAHMTQHMLLIFAVAPLLVAERSAAGPDVGAAPPPGADDRTLVGKPAAIARRVWLAGSGGGGVAAVRRAAVAVAPARLL